MRTFIKRAAVGGVLAIAFSFGGGAGTAQAAEGCVGFPGMGGLAYHCLAANPLLPSVSLSGSTPVGVTVPAFCYFVGCTSDTPVGTSVPFSISTSRPSSDVTVFRLSMYCYDYYGSPTCGTYYEIRYDAPGYNCVFYTNDPTLYEQDGRRVRCTV